MVRLLGLDPGLRFTGWGVIDVDGNRLRHIGDGVIATDSDDPVPERLKILHDALLALLDRFRPDEAAVEETYVNRNGAATLKLGYARGVALLAPALAGVPVTEYGAKSVKKAVVGTGGADKDQVEMMVRRLLPGALIRRADAADALAVAICHAHNRASKLAWARHVAAADRHGELPRATIDAITIACGTMILYARDLEIAGYLRWLTSDLSPSPLSRPQSILPGRMNGLVMRRMLFLAGLCLICMCVLMLQIMETRLLSVAAWYHLAFLAISMAMSGMTAGSLLVYFKAGFFSPERLLEHLSWIGAAFAIAVVAFDACPMVSSVLLTDTTTGMLVLGWLKLILIILPPYVFAGMAISLALTRSPWPVGIVYGVDLVGAAAGCLIALALMTWLDGVSALLAVGVIGAIAAACFRAARQQSRDPLLPEPAVSRWFVPRHPMLLAAVLAALAGFNAAIEPDGITPVLVKDQIEAPVPAAQAWNSYSRVRAEREFTGKPVMWGPSANLPNVTVPQRVMNIDGDAGTMMYRFNGDFATVGFLKYDVTNLGYAIRHEGKSAVIGVGGGRDILSAHLFGFPDVTGVELNPIFIDWLTNRFRSYNHLADLPGTRFFVDEARSWFAGTTERFNLIEMSLIDTWAATGAGAFSLSENGLYTIQGWQHFLNALTPNGILTVSRWYNPHDIAETGRLLSLAATTLRARGCHQSRSADLPGRNLQLWRQLSSAMRRCPPMI